MEVVMHPSYKERKDRVKEVKSKRKKNKEQGETKGPSWVSKLVKTVAPALTVGLRGLCLTLGASWNARPATTSIKNSKTITP